MKDTFSTNLRRLYGIAAQINMAEPCKTDYRLPAEVLREIKRRAGADFPVQYRFGLKHYVKAFNSGALPGENFSEAGRDIPEGLEMAKWLEAAGFDALHVDAGCYDSWYWPHPPTYQEPGAMADMAAQAKKAVRIPVITVGKLTAPALAERIIAEGKADLIALGKSLLADPFWVQKAAVGQPERIRPCIGCHDGCMGRIIRGKPLSCAVNPATGRERSYRIERADRPKKIVIVGGGVAGMEAARVSSLRGHQVVLYEKKQNIGGHLIPASVPTFKKISPVCSTGTRENSGCWTSTLKPQRKRPRKGSPQRNPMA